jgi:hypothetical protein
LYDETQEVARAYNAACTLTSFIWQSRQISLSRQLDDSRPGNGIHVSGNDLRGAIDSIIYNRTIPIRNQVLGVISSGIRLEEN